jgi:GntR family transcriptional regulator
MPRVGNRDTGSRELEHEDLLPARPGVGAFVTQTPAAPDAIAAHRPLRAELRRWIAKARRATLDEESIEARFATTFRAAAWDEAA